MDFVYIEDVARANLLAAQADVTDDVFNVASGVETSLLDLAQRPAVRDGLRPPGRVRPRASRGKVSRRLADTRRAREALGFEAEVDLEEGLQRLVEWWRAERARRRARAPVAVSVAMNVPFARPYLTGNEGERVAEVIASGWVSQGPQVQAFEEAFAERVGAAEAVATTSCTTALQLALHAVGRRTGRRGDRALAVVHRHRQCGLALRRASGVRRHRPAHVQPRPGRSRTGDHAADEGDHARPPGRLAGRHGRVHSRSRERHGVAIVEDAACAIGATYKGRPIGSLGPLACFSLHPRKVITTGEGGMIAVQDPDAGRAPQAAAPARDERLRPRPSQHRPGRHRGPIRSPASTTG